MTSEQGAHVPAENTADAAAPDSVTDDQVLAAIDTVQGVVGYAADSAFDGARAAITIENQHRDLLDLLDATAARVACLGAVCVTWGHQVFKYVESNQTATAADVKRFFDALSDQVTTLTPLAALSDVPDADDAGVPEVPAAFEPGTHVATAHQLVAAVNVAAGLLEHTGEALPDAPRSAEDGARMATEMRTATHALGELSKRLTAWADELAAKHQNKPSSRARHAAGEFRRIAIYTDDIHSILGEGLTALQQVPTHLTA